jgi:hypothetical protein
LSAFSKDELSFTTLFELPPVLLGKISDAASGKISRIRKCFQAETLRVLFYPVQMRKKIKNHRR